MNKCNRTACQSTKATWYNDVMQAYYCQRCASRINESARQTLGRDICHPPSANSSSQKQEPISKEMGSRGEEKPTEAEGIKPG